MGEVRSVENQCQSAFGLLGKKETRLLVLTISNTGYWSNVDVQINMRSCMQTLNIRCVQFFPQYIFKKFFVFHKYCTIFQTASNGQQSLTGQNARFIRNILWTVNFLLFVFWVKGGQKQDNSQKYFKLFKDVALNESPCILLVYYVLH